MEENFGFEREAALNKEGSYDALIVGAGPAGSFAAERLARGGARVALFDGRPAADAKACGGGVTSKALKAWPFLLEAGGRLVSEVEMCSPAGRSVRLELSEPFAIYSRRALDSHLRERARRAGAEVFEGRVTARWRGASRGVVCAWALRRDLERARTRRGDGSNPLRVAAGLCRLGEEVAFGYRTPLAETDNAPTVIAFLPGWAGYAWAFPRLDHISFGIATTQETFDHKALDRLLWGFMVGYYRRQGGGRSSLWASTAEPAPETGGCEIEERLRRVAERYAARIPGLAPETLDARRTAGEDWALLGDAAGFADPVTGEGIFYALRSAELFADAFLRGDVSAYEAMWRADFGRELRRASQMRRRFYGDFWGGAFTDRMIGFARLHRGIRRTLCELIAGDQSYLDLKPTLARRAAWPL